MVGGEKDGRLRQLAVLIVEDEWLVAMDLADELAAAGYRVIGPALSVSQALELLEQTTVDGALLDVNLGGETSYPVAESLLAKGISFAFVSGYAASQLRADFKDFLLLSKPVQADALRSGLERMLQQDV
ncbi:response regulator [Mesorhizobium sp. ESP-6-4]|uniref:response regulator n=1 Tax=Mesorhizobium sp. ESP-6-4 TaxID=2876624 RepID=UPI001CCECB15|nr:response regulator [Mesorhizobium sp. ESP-6-4]MBZ9661168.1 response regulator [Mesorhizobium sp. ESP-6-4]